MAGGLQRRGDALHPEGLEAQVYLREQQRARVHEQDTGAISTSTRDATRPRIRLRMPRFN